MKVEINELGAVSCVGSECTSWLDENFCCQDCPVVMLFKRAYNFFMSNNKQN